MVQVHLNGFLPPDFAGSVPLLDVRNPPPGPAMNYPPIDIGDGRVLQAAATSEAQFLAEHGFVLLPHRTAVRDWDNDIEQIYLPEIDEIIRKRLFPGRRIEVQQVAGGLLRRGRATGNPGYAGGIHSDAPLTAELYAANVRAFASAEAEAWWKARFEREDVAAFVNLDFWRVTNMDAPLRHMPLAVCDPSSVGAPDIVDMPMKGIAADERTTHHLGLRFNSGQHWYYYPDMTGDELLVFKLGEYWKDDGGHAPQNCFHTAFAHPDTPADAEERQSCEHRVGVLILKD